MIANSTHPTILYIVGTSRSGSTLLDHLLGCHPQAHSVGEMRRLQTWVRQDNISIEHLERGLALSCSCGAPIVTCPFWVQVQRRSGLDFQNSLFTHIGDKWRRLLLGGAWLLAGPKVARWINAALLPQGVQAAQNCFRVYDAIGQTLNVPYIVDSSKDLVQFVYLYLLHPERVKLIHLVRDGRAVAHSETRGRRAERWTDRKLSPFAQATRHWVNFNRKALQLANRLPANQRMFLRYEDLCENPEAVLKRIHSQFGLEPLGTSASMEAIEFHTVGGSLTLKTSAIRLDTSWQQHLTAEQLAEFERLGGKMSRRLGYRPILSTSNALPSHSLLREGREQNMNG